MEANPDEMKSLTVHEEVAKEEAVVNLLEHWRSGMGIGI
jgi:hypothetical protein